MDSKQPRQTTPEEEGIEIYPDAMERLERAVKTAARHGPIPAGTIKKATHRGIATGKRPKARGIRSRDAGG
jgi:hypothetical protein